MNLWRQMIAVGLAGLACVASNSTPAAAATPVTVNSITPARDATGVTPTTVVTATFNSMMNAATVNSTTFELRDALGNLVRSTAHAGGETPTSTLTPDAPLASGTRYSATVKGAAAGVRDEAGNAMVGDFSWSFTTSGTPPAPATCPCTIWDASAAPLSGAATDTASVELGVRFRSDKSGLVTGVRFYKFASNTGPHTGSIWNTTGGWLTSGTFTNESASGWQQLTFTIPVFITANTTYIASYHTNSGHYAASNGYFLSGVDNAPLHALQDGVDGASGVYRYGAASAFPDQTYTSTNYWIDVVFIPNPSEAPPTITTVSPAGNAVGVSTFASVTATFNKFMDPLSVTDFSTIPGATVELRTASGELVPARVTYDSVNRTAILDPIPLAEGTTYTATVRGGTVTPRVKDMAGASLAESYSWSFTTALSAPPPTLCPCTIWTPGTTTAIGPDPDSEPVELGVRFRSESNGFITGVRFYKHSTNTGTHVGNLWTNTGKLIASATFTNETGSGWQQVTFPAPVAITSNTTYVASYHTNVGHYAANFGYLFVGVDNTPLHALKHLDDGPNGVYRYGATSAFPDQSYSGTNYWVDVVFAAVGDIKPTIASTSPSSGAVGVSAATYVTATFSTFMDPTTVTDSTVSVRTASGTLVPSTVSYSIVNGTAILVPASPLTLGATYTATIKGGALDPRVKDMAGSAMAASYSWSFTIVPPEPPPPSPDPCPCTLWSAASVPSGIANDSNPVEVGVRFKSERSGYVTGVRFYKGSGNTGVHVGNLWTNTGTLLATATFFGESASGWQQVNFTFPVAIAANTYYMASYHTNTGHYAVDPGYFASAFLDNSPLHAPPDFFAGPNGVYAYSATSTVPFLSYIGTNYWVDVVFRHTQFDSSLPKVTAVEPAAGATGVGVTSSLQVYFNVGMNFTTVNTTTFELRDAAGGLVPSYIFFGESGGALMGHLAPLAYGTTYTATVKGGAAGVKDSRGLPLPSDFSWSFTTVPAP